MPAGFPLWSTVLRVPHHTSINTFPPKKLCRMVTTPSPPPPSPTANHNQRRRRHRFPSVTPVVHPSHHNPPSLLLAAQQAAAAAVRRVGGRVGGRPGRGERRKEPRRRRRRAQLRAFSIGRRGTRATIVRAGFCDAVAQLVAAIGAVRDVPWFRSPRGVISVPVLSRCDNLHHHALLESVAVLAAARGGADGGRGKGGAGRREKTRGRRGDDEGRQGVGRGVHGRGRVRGVRYGQGTLRV